MILFETYGSIFIGLMVILSIPIGVTVIVIRDLHRRHAARRRKLKARRDNNKTMTSEMYRTINHR